MPTYRKQSLFPGSFLGTDDTGARVRVTFSPDEVKHHHGRMKELLRHQLKVPVCFEHQLDAEPLTQEEWDRAMAKELRDLFVGYLLDAELEPDGALTLTFDAPDPAQAKLVERIKYVSPGIRNDYVDGTGRKWPGPSIMHLALTSRPVQHRQRPVERIRLSVPRKGMLWLSVRDQSMAHKPGEDEELDDLELDDEAAGGGDEPMEPEGEGEGAEGLEGLEEEIPEGEGEAAPPPAGGGDVDAMTDEASIAAELSQIVERAFNLHVPPVPHLKTWVQHFRTAALTSEMHQGGNTPSTPDDEPEDDEDMDLDDELAATAGGGAEEVTNPNVMLSLQRENARLKQQLSARDEKALAAQRQRYQKRVERVAAVLGDNAEVQRLVREVGSVRLSMGADGRPAAADFEARLRMAEALLSDPRLKAKATLARAKKKANGNVNLSLRGRPVEEEAYAAEEGSQPLDPHVMERLSLGRYQANA